MVLFRFEVKYIGYEVKFAGYKDSSLFIPLGSYITSLIYRSKMPTAYELAG